MKVFSLVMFCVRDWYVFFVRIGWKILRGCGQFKFIVVSVKQLELVYKVMNVVVYSEFYLQVQVVGKSLLLGYSLLVLQLVEFYLVYGIMFKG